MLSIVKIPPVEKIAIPLKAAPLVQPLPSWEPKPNNAPPIIAAAILVPDLIAGDFSNVRFNLFEINPDKKAPNRAPITSNTSHDFKGLSP